MAAAVKADEALVGAYNPTSQSLRVTGGGASTADGGAFTAGTDNGTPIEGVYESSPTTVANNKYGVVGIDSTRNLKVTQATLLAGEDLTNNVMKVENRYPHATISTATTTAVKSGSGFLHRLTVTGGTTGTIVVYDNTAASGAKIADFDTTNPLASYELNVSFATGLTTITSAATKSTVSYR